MVAIELIYAALFLLIAALMGTEAWHERDFPWHTGKFMLLWVAGLIVAWLI